VLRRILALAGVILLGLVIGAASGVIAISPASMGSTDFSGWKTSTMIGSPAADPYTRAIVARTGLLALTRQETVYFTRATDEKGRPLTDKCIYRLDGGSLPTRWWSVTLYAADNYLAVNGDNAHSFDATRAGQSGEGRWSVVVGRANADKGPWISTRNSGRFTLTLRLYNPEASVLQNPASLSFPTIRTLSCGGVGA